MHVQHLSEQTVALLLFFNKSAWFLRKVVGWYNSV